MRARAWMAAIAAFAGSGAVALFACSVLVPLDDVQCGSASDCAARGAAFAGAVCVDHLCVPPPAGDDAGTDALDAAVEAESGPAVGPWRCLDQPPEVLDPAARIDVTIIALDALQPITTAGPTGGSDLTLVAGTTLSGVTIHACNPLDPLCGAPVTPDVVTDDAGVAHVTVPGDFTGFYSLARNNVVTTDFYFGQLLTGEKEASYPAPVLSKTGVQLLAQSIGVAVDLSADASTGMVFFNAYDCDDRHAPGVTFALSSTDAKTVAWYIKNGLPTTSASQTDSLGAAGAVNVPLGQLVVTATLADGHRALGASNVVIHPGSATIAYFRVRTH